MEEASMAPRKVRWFVDGPLVGQEIPSGGWGRGRRASYYDEHGNSIPAYRGDSMVRKRKGGYYSTGNGVHYRWTPVGMERQG
jgi:hypothetical protein